MPNNIDSIYPSDPLFRQPRHRVLGIVGASIGTVYTGTKLASSGLANLASDYFRNKYNQNKFVPAPRLVDVEPNPGPTSKRILKKILNIEKQHVDGKMPKSHNQNHKLNKTVHLNARDVDQISTYSAPINTAFNYTTNRPVLRSVKNGVCYKHTEYVFDTASSNTSNTFIASAYLINPANTLLFPWLSSQAAAFAAFRFKKLTFHLRSMVATNTNGAMFLTSTPDVSDSTPNSKSELMQFENAVRANIWEHLEYNVPTSTLNRLPEYLCSNLTSNVVDSTRELGKLFLGSSGVTGGGVQYGELYVTYDVELYHPQTPVAASSLVAASPVVNFPFASGISTSGTIQVNQLSFDSSSPNNMIQYNRPGTYIMNIIGAGFNTLTATGDGNYNVYDSKGVSLLSRTTVVTSTIAGAGTSFSVMIIFQSMPSPWYFLYNGPVATIAYGIINIYITAYTVPSTIRLDEPKAKLTVKDDYEIVDQKNSLSPITHNIEQHIRVNR